MNKQSIFFSIIVAIVSIAIFLIFLKILSKWRKINLVLDRQINLSYSIWICSFLISFVLFLKIALELIENSIETIIYSKTTDDAFLAVMERITIFIGFTFLFTFFSYYLINIIIKIFSGDRQINLEIENNNFGYFIIEGICFILFVYSILNLFEHFLRWFSPFVGSPFYH